MNLENSTPADTYTALLSGSAINPVSTGVTYRVEWGNGVGTALWLGNGIVGVGTSLSAHSAQSSEATVVRQVAWPDQAGRVVIATNLHAVLASDFALTSTTAADVGLELTIPVGTWAVFFSGDLQSSNTDSGVLLTVDVTAATLVGGSVVGDPLTSPAANTNFGHRGTVLVTVTSGTGTIKIKVAAEAASRTATVKAGSILFATRMG